MPDILVSLHGKRLGITAPDSNGKCSLVLDGEIIAGVGVTITIPAPTSSVRGGVLQQSAITPLTDSSGGTSGGNTVAVVPAATAATTDTSAASLTSVNSALTAIKNDIATLAAKQNATIASDKSAGVTA
ncbi:hypothetical protein H0I68_15990 [Yersinia kristensenii]|uniref:hypothetical protein n=1 Tax=Yersinia kristensenii TaxID=28152 RepID=UPI001C60AFAC|nr:hypothetical protein [Yersinia kristensenii]MBW5826543.1 hypothetical protein [Yersinia kristensenii]